MLITKTSGEFPREYVPTVFENYEALMNIGDKTVNMGFWDTAGAEDNDRSINQSKWSQSRNLGTGGARH